MCVALIWSWWGARNKLRDEGRKIDLASLVWRVRNTAGEFLQFFGAVKKPTVHAIVCWQKPPLDHLKINVDGSFNKENSVGGWGYVVRDSDGDVHPAVWSGAVPTFAQGFVASDLARQVE